MPHADLATRRAYNAAYKRAQRARWRAGAITTLGDGCARCGGNDRLQIDHIHGGGRTDRRQRGCDSILQAVIAGEPGFQLLCHPHHTEKTTEEVREYGRIRK